MPEIKTLPRNKSETNRWKSRAKFRLYYENGKTVELKLVTMIPDEGADASTLQGKQLINHFLTGHFIWSALQVMGWTHLFHIEPPSSLSCIHLTVFFKYIRSKSEFILLLYHSRLVGGPPSIRIYLSTPYPKGALWEWDPVTL